jgi:hypothetical protein
MPYITESEYSSLVAATVREEQSLEDARKDILARVEEHDGRLSEEEVQYVAGLRDALAILDKRTGHQSTPETLPALAT